MPFEVKDIDRTFYNERLADFLPAKMIDVHTHVWLKTFFDETSVETRGAKWPSLVADENPIKDLFRTYQLMFPRQTVAPLIFGSPRRGVIFEQTNGYVSQVARQHNLPSLIVSTPEWSAEELEQRVSEGGFLGLKPYLSFAPAHISTDDITILSDRWRGGDIAADIERPIEIAIPVEMIDLAIAAAEYDILAAIQRGR